MTPIRRAYTLAEMVASLSVVSILLAGMGSAVLISTSALPAESPDTGLLGSALASTRLADDLAYATSVTVAEAQAVECLLPDRDADGAPERVRYAWSGTPGDPLTRSFNNGPAVTVLDDVQSLAFGYDLSSETTRLPGVATFVESAESLLISISPADGVTPTTVDLSNKPCGQAFTPYLPSDAVAWSVTRVRFKGAAGGRSGTIPCTLYLLNDDLTPTDTVIATQDLSNDALSGTLSAIEVAFTDARSLDPNAGLAFVLDPPQKDLISIEQAETETISGGAWVYSNGTRWFTDAALAQTIEVYGTYTRTQLGASRALVRQRLDAIDLAIQTSEDRSGQIEHRVPLLNRPALLSRQWSATFDQDPTTQDLDADGIADFKTAGSGTASTELASGRWAARSVELRTAPEITFTEPTVISLQWLDTTADGEGGRLMLAPDWNASSAGQLTASIEAGDLNSVISVELLEPDGGSRVVASASASNGGASELILVVDPVNDALSITIDEMSMGTFAYGTASSLEPGAVRLFASGGVAGPVIDNLSVTVGGTIVSDAADSNTAPVAVASVSASSSTVGTSLTFHANGSSDADGDPLTAVWDFGDGDVTVGASVTHAFAETGTYPVTLTVYDDSLASSTDTVFINVLRVTVTDTVGAAARSLLR